MNEKELRKKIREELKQNHEKNKKQSEADKREFEIHTPDKDLYHPENYNDYQKEAIIRATEEEICSQYP